MIISYLKIAALSIAVAISVYVLQGGVKERQDLKESKELIEFYMAFQGLNEAVLSEWGADLISFDEQASYTDSCLAVVLQKRDGLSLSNPYVLSRIDDLNRVKDDLKYIRDSFYNVDKSEEQMKEVEFKSYYEVVKIMEELSTSFHTEINNSQVKDLFFIRSTFDKYLVVEQQILRSIDRLRYEKEKVFSGEKLKNFTSLTVNHWSYYLDLTSTLPDDQRQQLLGLQASNSSIQKNTIVQDLLFSRSEEVMARLSDFDKAYAYFEFVYLAKEEIYKSFTNSMTEDLKYLTASTQYSLFWEIVLLCVLIGLWGQEFYVILRK